jgi:lysophospholipase L1-like esterase
MMGYLILAGTVFGVNLLPAFGPPTWAVLVFFRLQSTLDVVPLVLVGALAAASGRLVLAFASRRFRDRLSAGRLEIPLGLRLRWVVELAAAARGVVDFGTRTRQHVVGRGLMDRDRHLRWTPSWCGTLIAVLVAVAVALPSPASASAARLYVAVGDSVGAGFGATSGHSSFDLYCAYLKSAVGGSLVDQCVNESVVGVTSQSALDGGTIQKAVNDIDGSTDTPIVTVVLGGNDLLGSPGCQPITGAGCNFIRNMRTILNQLETALASHPGPHLIQWLEYYNPNHDNPFGNSSSDQSTAASLLGNDAVLSACTSNDLQRIGLNDAINCIAKEKGATPVDAFTPFQSGCTNRDCFSDSLHPDDKGYGLIFDALRDTPGTAVPATPPPDGSWPMATGAPTNTLLPTVAGIPAPGSPLSCSLGTWSGSAPIHFTVEWLSDNSPIAGHTASTYLVPATDLGHEISCRVTASNADGSAEATSRSLKVTSPPSLRATISALSETKKAFAPSGRHHKRGTVFSFRLNQPARVTIAIQRQAPGRRVGRSCRHPRSRLRHKPRCTRTILVAALGEQGHAGLNEIAFSGLVRGRALEPGRYRAVFAAIGRAGASRAQTLHFRIV